MHSQELRGYDRNTRLSTPSSEHGLKTVAVDVEGKCVAELEGYPRMRRAHSIWSKLMLASNGRVKRYQRHCQCSQEATGTPDEAAVGPAACRREKFERKENDSTLDPIHLLDDHTGTG